MRFGQRLEKLEERAVALIHRHVAAFILRAPDIAILPSAFEPIAPGLVAVVMSLNAETRGQVVAALTADPSPRTSATLTVLDYGASVSAFIIAATTGRASETCALGARGDGKPVAGASAQPIHARQHAEAGYALPTRVLAATGSHVEHRQKLCRTLMAPMWGGAWVLKDDQHVAEFISDGIVWCSLDLIGVNDVGAMDKLRTECHGIWFEEVIPASEESSGGMSIDSWLLARTSQRLASSARPAIITSNYGDESSWPWKRFFIDATPGRAGIRIAPGERASAEFRAEMEASLADRPDLLDRLVKGEPAAVVQGEAIASSYNPALHVAPSPLIIDPAWPLVVGVDGGLTPTCVVTQNVNGRVRVFAGLFLERGGMRQLLEGRLLPWLAAHAPWAIEARGRTAGQTIHWYIDPTLRVPGQADIEARADRLIRELVGGVIRDGLVKWGPRVAPLHAVCNRMVGGRPALQIDPGQDTEHLRRALARRWHYPRRPNGEIARDDPVKDHPWSDLGDSLCYALGASGMRDLEARARAAEQARRTPPQGIGFDPLDPTYGRDRSSDWSFPR